MPRGENKFRDPGILYNKSCDTAETPHRKSWNRGIRKLR